ncbi:G-type lectin S-receptor-like serine/threonine-protein kinase [Glycine soja]
MWSQRNNWRNLRELLEMMLSLAEDTTLRHNALIGCDIGREFSMVFSNTKFNPTGTTEHFLWSSQTQSWDIVNTHPIDQCEYYAVCGVNSNCNINDLPICVCLQGFIPKYHAKWDSHDWSGGFLKYSGMKLRDISSSWFNKSLSLKECETLCLRNCLYTAYANLYVIGGGNGYLHWFDDIVDMRNHTDEGQEIYIRLPFFELGTLAIITPNESIQGNRTLVSSAGTFEAGFFNFGNSQGQYFGIWYKNISPKTIVWVANKDAPVKDSTAFLTLTHQGDPVILDGSRSTTVWFSNSSRIAEKPIMQLLDSGNLVVKDGNSKKENFLWESFDYPGNTFLAGMKLRTNLVSGPYRSLTSWKNAEDPGSGEFSYHIDAHGFPQLVTTKGEILFSRAGSWTGFVFSGVSWRRMLSLVTFSLAINDKEVTYQYETLKAGTVTMLVINPSGFVQRLLWSERTGNWEILSTRPMDQCEYYAFCDVNSLCNVTNSPKTCTCLEGFVPKFYEKWSALDWSGGCVRRINLSCEGDVFQKYAGMKLPDTSSSWYDKSLNLEKCEKLCLKNCSCTAYANVDVDGRGCLLWFDNIVDLTRHTDQGQDIYIRLAASELDGQEIAVKRLAKTSEQGAEQFKNEVMLMAKLQHRNLVKLLGCSIHQKERLLIYEYMSNRSLDYFIFDSTQSKQLDLTKRLQIIDGIARGLLYLHQDSRLRIIHRDLKVSNILLDNDMNPKISDFGLARTFGGDQAEANTNRVMGTYFGVIVLEIISGRKNRNFQDSEHHLNLLSHAWRLWIEEKPLELIDDLLDDPVSPHEILRCIHVGLLCVQQTPENRPNMSSVVLMLNGEKLLPDPSQPGFYTGTIQYPIQLESSSRSVGACSQNEATVSLLEAR